MKVTPSLQAWMFYILSCLLLSSLRLHPWIHFQERRCFFPMIFLAECVFCMCVLSTRCSLVCPWVSSCWNVPWYLMHAWLVIEKACDLQKLKLLDLWLMGGGGIRISLPKAFSPYWYRKRNWAILFLILLPKKFSFDFVHCWNLKAHLIWSTLKAFPVVF